MTMRTRDLMNRSRALLGGTRLAASQLLAAQAARPSSAGPATGDPAAPPAPSPGEEAMSAICADIALRDLNLVDSLLAQLEDMESREEDADRLAELYRLDHLATRLRRNAENLRVLAGRDAGEHPAETASLLDVIRGAMSSIDHYQRVTVGRVVTLGVVGFAAEDVSRLLAELLDNATKSSPPHAPVRVGGHLTEAGSALLRVEDEGIGLPGERLEQINQRLTAEPVLDDDAVRHMGLAVVRRLATRHGIRTWLDQRHPHGTTASVLLPAALVCELDDVGWSGLRTVASPPGGPAADRAGDAPAMDASAPSGARPATAVAGARSAALAAPAADPLPGPMPTRISGTTASGLPKRVSHSLRGARGDADGPVRTGGPRRSDGTAESDPRAGLTRLLADLGAFSQGERAARAEQRADGGRP
jgi:hypothetical protein